MISFLIMGIWTATKQHLFYLHNLNRGSLIFFLHNTLSFSSYFFSRIRELENFSFYHSPAGSLPFRGNLPTAEANYSLFTLHSSLNYELASIVDINALGCRLLANLQTLERVPLAILRIYADRNNSCGFLPSRQTEERSTPLTWE